MLAKLWTRGGGQGEVDREGGVRRTEEVSDSREEDEEDRSRAGA